MQYNSILKNKVVLYSILLSILLHVFGFFVLGRFISIKAKSLSNLPKSRVILISLANFESDGINSSEEEGKIEKRKNNHHRKKNEYNKKESLKEKKTAIDNSKKSKKISNVTLNNTPENITKSKISRMENVEEMGSSKSILQENRNFKEENTTSILKGNESKIISPDYRINKKPIYPRAARIKGYQGTVYLKITLNSKGKVIKSTIKKSSGYKILDRAALRASYNWYFKPAYINGNAISTTILVPVEFKLQENGS